MCATSLAVMRPYCVAPTPSRTVRHIIGAVPQSRSETHSLTQRRMGSVHFGLPPAIGDCARFLMERETGLESAYTYTRLSPAIATY
jgi:hypothetical protein